VAERPQQAVGADLPQARVGVGQPGLGGGICQVGHGVQHAEQAGQRGRTAGGFGSGIGQGRLELGFQAGVGLGQRGQPGGAFLERQVQRFVQQLGQAAEFSVGQAHGSLKHGLQQQRPSASRAARCGR
jgi:hypothetical protein